ncbi:N-acetylmuramoyl-L-alanine amidase, family 4 [Lentilactobacillus kosonis]|uniref:N-acetylmuramoyl-L-alanine amidase, family 4 n=1 Tax=Lentilactobacillus kosonis TaxID=2810561 RepID=A0A401FKB3_9LACO|nr:glucosaminidase domain-containing protein [Lentilactobacillus kosonis]GAY72736.1 N-acetylmuramoyl-L-alanine amidase, family 4 [Lentilactobacillus kosonis]
MKLKAIQKAVALSCATLLLAGGFSSFHKVVKADSGSAATQTTQSTFISQYKGDVQKAANKYRLYASVMMAQAALESGWGQSQLTKQANNFFGIKGAYNGQAVSMPTTEYDQNGQIQNINANFKNIPRRMNRLAIMVICLETEFQEIHHIIRAHGRKTRIHIKMQLIR